MTSELKKSNHVFQFNKDGCDISERQQRSQSAYDTTSVGQGIENHPFFKQRRDKFVEQGYYIKAPHQHMYQSQNLNRRQQIFDQKDQFLQQQQNQNQNQQQYHQAGSVDPSLERNPIDMRRSLQIIRVPVPYSSMFQSDALKQSQLLQEKQVQQEILAKQKTAESDETAFPDYFDKKNLEEKVNEIKFKLCDLENQTKNYGKDLEKNEKDSQINHLQFNKQQLSQISDLISNVKQLGLIINQTEECSHKTPFKGGQIHSNNLKMLNSGINQQQSTQNTLNFSQQLSSQNIQSYPILKSSYGKFQVDNVKQNLENKFNNQQNSMTLSRQSLKATPNPLLNKRISLTKLQSSDKSDKNNNLNQQTQQNDQYVLKNKDNQNLSNSQIFNRNLQNFNQQFPLYDQKVFAKPTNLPNSSLRNSQIFIPESHKSVDPNLNRSQNIYQSQQIVQNLKNDDFSKNRNTIYNNINDNQYNSYQNLDMYRNRSQSNFQVVRTEETIITTTTTRRFVPQKSATGTKLDDYFDNQKMCNSVHITPRSQLYNQQEQFQQQQNQNINKNIKANQNPRQSLIQDYISGKNSFRPNIYNSNQMDFSDQRAQKQKEYNEQFVKKQMENIAMKQQQ
ncbi:hypothetical protein PPERSA_01824 [Pseudocohnilembus persalinus]|uniref:Uncharacterized protein n=1 Tax=Pseudocohnilembus persalinus TaxID=266149 RepID=A0A0V0QKA4_PSEPJ|nr:hypothetical protein PPERSA_01824 [Pseudocohnilembus persalinus]|eukprot:KRX02707.1 hypothetical protein PPERSA_01824 [Pseudocohnilembus persalinus]